MRLRNLALLLFGLLLGGCGHLAFSEDLVSQFQPPIVTDSAPKRPLFGRWNLANNTTRVGLAEMNPVIPSYDGKGQLLASWNPHSGNTRSRLTFIVMHGGHGLVPGNFASALWLRQSLAANVLILDSYWSRGKQENWRTANEFGANMRALDAIAAGQWLTQTQGIDPSRLFLMGGSQGGWAVLRTLTDEPYFAQRSKNLFAGGIALYPVCRTDGGHFYPRLGPYILPIIIFTGGRDTATPSGHCDKSIFLKASQWIHYPDQTHGWDNANRGAHTPAVDGECHRAMNEFKHFEVCRSDKTTEAMHQAIIDFVLRVSKP